VNSVPSRKKINLEKVLASLNTTCPTCGRVIEPAEIKRVSWDEIECPDCNARFEPSRRKGVTCPHCHQETGIGTAAAFDHIFMSRKACEKCGREFLIVDGAPMTEDQYRRKGEA
jgi:DNA-directed RNA polymerase subunit RPC12/RpoP